MNDDIESQTERDINDLIGQSRRDPGQIQVSSEDVEEKLETKIHQIDDEKKEQVTRE